MWTLRESWLKCVCALPRSGLPAANFAMWNSFMQQVSLVTAFIALLFASSAQALAGLSISMPSETVYTDAGVATLDVEITGDGATSFGSFTLDFKISADASNPLTPLEALEFVAPPSNPSLDPTLNNPSYIFPGNSLDLSPSPTAFGGVSGASDTLLSVGDTTGDFSDVTLGSGTSKLLAELVFIVPTNITNTAGDKFDITLTNQDTALQSNNTGLGVALGGSATAIVTIEQASVAAVPEPATFGTLLVGFSGLLLLRRKSPVIR